MKLFSQNLDIISENIIYLFSLNSHLSATKLAKILSLPRRIVEHRIIKLYAGGFIRPLLIYNHNNSIKATLFIKLAVFDQKCISSVQRLNSLIKVKETLGLYDFSLLVAVKDEQELQSLIHKVNGIFHNSIQILDVILINYEDTLGYKSLCHNLQFLSKYGSLNPDKNHFLNDHDKKVIEILQKTPLISYKNLVSTTKKSYVILKSTIKELQEKGIIRFSIDPDYTKLGLEFHNVLVRINPAKKVQFEKNMAFHPRVHWIKKCTGRWDYVLSVVAQNMNDFIDITREIRMQNKDYIFEFSSLVSKINIMRKY